MSEFTDQVVMVVGAVGNLGFAVTKEFAQDSGRLCLVDRAHAELYELFPDYVDNPDVYLASCTDMTDPEQVRPVVEAALDKFKRIDVLVNTIGAFRAGENVQETSLQTWDFMMNLNLKSALLAMQLVTPGMLAQGRGKIISIAARPGLAGRAGMSAYSASKAALIRLTESLSAEVKHQGINVNCVLPGTIDTPPNRAANPEADFGAWVQPESIAAVIRFLASQAAADIHGAAIPVYGRT